jgi:hypothetical protein
VEEESTDQMHQTSPSSEQGAEAEARPGWHEPAPHALPEPTHWPFVLAAGTVLLLWGVVTSVVISGVGALIIIVALVGWIGDLRHEQRT